MNKRFSLYLSLCLLIVIIILTIILIIRWYEVNRDVSSQVIYKQSLKIHELSVQSVEGRYLFTGTIVWDRGIELASIIDGQYDYNHPFSQLDSYQPQDYQAWFTDLECPISADDVDPQLGYTTLQFNCLPQYLPYARNYFEFFNLANNHADNSGRDVLEETRRILGEYQGQYFGDPDPTYKEHLCEIVGLPVQVVADNSAYSQAYLPIAICAFHYFYRLPQPAELAVLEEYAQVLPVFAFVHMGAEYSNKADTIQQSIARQIIDKGALFVIANNPHWVQNSEIYEDKLIVYSTGNFIFDQTWNEELKRSASIVMNMSVESSADLNDWLSLGSACVIYQDSCLDIIRADNLDKLDLDLDFNVVAGYIDEYQPQTKADHLQEWVEERLNWQDR